VSLARKNAFHAIGLPRGHADTTDTNCAEYSLEGSEGPPIADGLARLDAEVGAFISFEQLSTARLVHAAPIEQRDTLGLTAKAGIRVAIAVKNVPRLGWRIRWRPLHPRLRGFPLFRGLKGSV
jgi:hypothetical protein